MLVAFDNTVNNDNEVCIEISGQIRGDVQALSEYGDVARFHKCDYVVSTWNKSGFKNSGPFRLPQRNRVVGKVFGEMLPVSWHFNQFKEWYPEILTEIIRMSSEISEQTIREIFYGLNGCINVVDSAIANELVFQSEVWDLNSRKMLYHVRGASHMRRYLEQKNGKLFNRIIRVRPDYSLNPAVCMSDLKLKHTIYTPWILENLGLADEAAVLSSQSMDIYSSLFDYTMCEPARKWRGIHSELGFILKENGLSCESLDCGAFRVNGELEAQFCSLVKSREDFISLLCVAAYHLNLGDIRSAISIIDVVDAKDNIATSSFLRLKARLYKQQGLCDKAAACAVLSVFDIALSEAVGPDRAYIQWACELMQGTDFNVNSIPVEFGYLSHNWIKCMENINTVMNKN
jgi:hypothetical protein